MPFTASHAAAILPFWNKKSNWISQTGLLVGAFVPDFEYFFRFGIKSDISHTWWGFLLFGIPVGILLSYVWHNTVRDALIHNLPYFFQQRWNVYTEWSWNKYFKKHWKAILISLTLGCSTHYLWDSFTHYYGFVVEAFPQLRTYAFADMTWYRIIQHSSTAIGLLILIWFVAKMPVNPKRVKPIVGRYWLSVFLISIMVFSARMLAGNIDSNAEIGLVVVSLISACLLGVFLAPSFLPKK